MGKNANQIATFGNLKDIGYRWNTTTIGSPDDSHCVINSDLYKLRQSSGLENTYPGSWNLNDAKTIKWSDIPGASRQVITTSNGVTNAYELAHNTCSIYIEEHVTGKTDANTINFYYNYQLSGSATWYKLLVDTNNLGANGQIENSSVGVGFLVLNPYVNGTVVSDYLSITCGTTSKNQTWKYKLGYGSEPSSWITYSGNNAKSCTLEIGKQAGILNYTKTIKTLTHAYFYLT